MEKCDPKEIVQGFRAHWFWTHGWDRYIEIVGSKGFEGEIVGTVWDTGVR